VGSLVLALASVAAFAQPPPECQEALDAVDQARHADVLGAVNRCLDLDLTPGARAFMLQVRAKEFARLARPRDALRDQLASIALDTPRDVWPWVMLGVYHRDLKQYPQSLAALGEAMRHDEDGPGTGPGRAVYYQTGWTLHEAGRYAEAIAAYTKSIRKQPDDGHAFYRRGLAYEATHAVDKARADYANAARFVPDEGFEAEIAAKLKAHGYVVKQAGK
jgi:tetratricopeptide (TPR) repeat protein